MSFHVLVLIYAAFLFVLLKTHESKCSYSMQSHSEPANTVLIPPHMWFHYYCPPRDDQRSRQAAVEAGCRSYRWRADFQPKGGSPWIWDWMFPTKEHLTPASAQKSVHCGPGSSGATPVCSAYREAKQMQRLYVRGDIFSITFFPPIKQELLGKHSSVLLTIGIPNPVKWSSVSVAVLSPAFCVCWNKSTLPGQNGIHAVKLKFIIFV